MAIENVGPGGVSRSGGARTRTAVNEADGGHAYLGTDVNNNIGLLLGDGVVVPINLETIGSNTCAIVGDSITGQCLSVSGVGGELQAYDPPSAIYSRTQDKGYMSWLQVLSGNAFIPVFNGGSSGEKTYDVLARINDVLDYSPRWVFELSGTNNAGALVVTYSNDKTACENAIYSDRVAIWAACKNKGARVVALAIPPDATTGALHTADELGVINRVNRRLKNYALNNGIFWVDVHAKLVNPANAAGHGVDSYFDGTVLHPGPYGAYVMAKEIWAQINKFVQPYTGLVSSQGDFYTVDSLSKNIMPPADGLMQNGTNTTAQTGTTGTYPAGSGSNAFLVSRLSGTGTGTVLTPASPDGVGNGVSLTIATGAAEDTYRMLWADGSPSITKLPAGSSVYFECLVKVTNAAALRALQGSIIVTTTGGASAGTYTSMSLVSTGQTGITDATGFTGVIRTPVINIPADTTGITLIRCGLQPVFSGDGTGTVITMSRMSIIKA